MTTATVETLTAEVRVLKVGNRQITLSVAKQLDRCQLGELEPMGRVKLFDKNLVIGRYRDDGTLRLAQLPPWPGRTFTAEAWLNIPNVRVCENDPAKAEGTFGIYGSRGVRFGDLTWVPEPVSWCGLAHVDGHLCQPPISDNETVRDLVTANNARSRAQWDAQLKAYTEGMALPLIVLAGLK